MKDNDWDWKGAEKRRFNWRALAWEYGRWCYNTNDTLWCAWEWEYETTGSIVVTRKKRSRRIYLLHPKGFRRRDPWGSEYVRAPNDTWIEAANGKVWVKK